MPLNTPDKFRTNDWTKYTFGAVHRETGEKWKPKGYVVATWTRSFKKLIESGLDSYILALGVDLLALDWSGVEFVSLWQTLSVGAFTFPFRQQLLRPSYFWRAVWFSRYARTEHEVQYYRYWMSQIEEALDAEPGALGVAELLKKSRDKLITAEAKVRNRGGEPAFKMHWLRDWNAGGRA